MSNLSTETVQSAALSLESIDNIEGGDSLSLGVLGVGDSVSDDTFEEGLQDAASLLVDHCLDGLAIICDAWQEGSKPGESRHTGRDTLDTATTRETTDCRLGYALDVVTKNLSVTLGSAFAETFSTFSACTDASVCCCLMKTPPWKAAIRVEATHVQSC